MTSRLIRFNSYIEAGTLPSSSVEARCPDGGNTFCTLVRHGPSPGLEYAPMADLIISLVHRSSNTEVVRDIGLGKVRCLDSPKRVFVTPANTASYWSFTGTPTVLHIAIAWQRVKEFLTLHNKDTVHGIERLAHSPFDDPLINAVAWRLWTTLSKNEPDSGLFCDQSIHLLLATLLLRGADGTKSSGRGTLTSWQLRRSQEFIRENLEGSVRLADIAGNIGLSPHHFLRAFKSTTGQTPMQWMTEQRIERAKELMAAPEISLTSIAIEVGFSSASHFSTTFRQATGLTPTAWRREWIR